MSHNKHVLRKLLRSCGGIDRVHVSVHCKYILRSFERLQILYHDKYISSATGDLVGLFAMHDDRRGLTNDLDLCFEDIYKGA